MSMAEQVLSLFAAKNGYLDQVKTEEVSSFERKMHAYFKANHPEIIDEIEKTGQLSDELSAKISEGMKEITEQFNLARGVN